VLKLTEEKQRSTTTIEVSIETYTKLHSVRSKLEEITRQSISFNQALQILLTAKPLDLMLEEMILNV